MKRCEACGTTVAGGHEFCPLCGDELLPVVEDKGQRLPNNTYPDLSGRTTAYNLVWRILLFASLLACGVSVLINLLTYPSFLWCLIVVTAVAYCWLTVPPMLRRGQNYAARTFFTVFLTSLFVLALDFIVGYSGWSINYVVPALCTGGVLSIGAVMLFRRTSRAQYALYQFMLGVMGLVPLALYLFGVSHSLVMAIVSASVSFASLLGTFVFGDKRIKNEFKRRFHM